MTRTRMLVAVALVAAAAGGARAQSPFALQSVGQRLADGDARMLGRGGWGLAEQDTLHPGFKNPASAAGVRQVGLALTGYGESAGRFACQPRLAGSLRRPRRTAISSAVMLSAISAGDCAPRSRPTGAKTRANSAGVAAPSATKPSPISLILRRLPISPT